MARPSPYPPELRERAVRMVAEIRPNYPTEWAAMKAVAAKLGIDAAETVRTWVRKAEVDGGQRPGVTSEEAAEVKRLRAENADLRRANEILKAGVGFLRGRARPSVETLVAFIDAHRQVLEVEPICRVLTGHGLKIATSTYYAARNRAPAPGRSVTLVWPLGAACRVQRWAWTPAGAHTVRPSAAPMPGRQPSSCPVKVVARPPTGLPALHLAERFELDENAAPRIADSARSCWNRLPNSTFAEIHSPGSHRAGDHGRVTSTAAAIALQDHAALWSGGEIPASDVVHAACDALVAGLDTPGLRILAACTRAEADHDVHDLLPQVLDELGLPFSPVDSEAGQEAVARALARRMLAGELTPREFAFRIHHRHGHKLPLTERLAELDDEYDVLEYGDRTVDQVAAEVTAEARRLAARPKGAAGPTDPGS